MKKYTKKYKYVKKGIVGAAAVATIGAGLVFLPAGAHAANIARPHIHTNVQRKAPAWRKGLRAAEAQVMGMNVADFKTARKTSSLRDMVTDHGMTYAGFDKKVGDTLVAQWQQNGVSQSDINARLAKLQKFQHRRELRWEAQASH